MKKVNPQRFQQKKPENISFQASPILENQPKKTKKNLILSEKNKSERPNDRTTERTEVRNTTEKNIVSGNTYLINIPNERIKTRHSFDIFKDQQTALNKIQLAIMDNEYEKRPVLGDMIQEALDSYIKEKCKKLKNIEIVRDRTNGRPTERTETKNNDH